MDGTKAVNAARTLGLDLVTTRLTSDDVSRVLSSIDLPFEPTLMDRSLWCLYSIVSQSAREAGTGVILLGQLADELFGGYAKYAEALSKGGEDAAKSMMKADVEEYAQRGRVRDVRACARWVEARFPFESRDLVAFGLSIPVAFKIREGNRKAILRQAAMTLGVPEELARTAKKAAQYSSGVQKMVADSPF
jgi:asparagine synthase (glutamine-hydrolysing)